MIPGLALISLAFCITLGRALRWCLVGSLLAAILLWLHHNHLVNEPGFVGRMSVRLRSREAEERNVGQQLKIELQVLGKDDFASYPAGWAEELPFARTPRGKQIFDAKRVPARYEIGRDWHSELTGIFRLERVPLRCWYPGGPLSEAWDKVEFRP